MGRDSVGVVAGLAVLVLGVITVVDLIGRGPDPQVATPASPITTVEAMGLRLESPLTEPDLPGVSPEVTRVLRWSGNAAPASDGDLAQLPPSVAALLIESGIPLRVPIGQEATR